MRAASLVLALSLACTPRSHEADPPKASGGGEALVLAEVRRLEPGADIDVTRRPGTLLPGLELYDATVLIPDHPGHRCAVRGQDVWCDNAMLARIVETYGLGAKPAQLDDARWIELCAITTRTEPLPTAGTAQHLASYAPAEAKAKIAAPKVTRTSEGVQVAYFIESVVPMSFPSGPKSLLRVELRISPKDVATMATETVWEGH